MSHPTFKHFIGVMHGMLSAKAGWLADESLQLSVALQLYGGELDVDGYALRDLVMAAYLKNVGAIYLPAQVLSQRMDEPAAYSAIKTQQLIAANIARHSGLHQVATILDGYYQRSIPRDYHTSVFQIVNCWVSCRTSKGYRPAMTIGDSRLTMQQRARMCWSDPVLVEHFLEHYPDVKG